ncbi:metal-binding protein [Natronorubrum sp. JWXQ-INN-674]|uniref:Metal-binding protein n=1 Tax=Natronorubrum halalkaliphilum TaxID=2691917 RepID=A0A6B0VM25_9EURY|nr:DUF411 domain-containing protein [Natronorubrum halalkaliphilum]MXV62137.1 metal-binding protein [Natronorubrum halalkaliphilum]
MAISRRRLCSVGGTLVFIGLAGCLDGTDDGTDTAERSRSDTWAWSGSVPVESVVQHHDPSCGCCSEYVAYLETNGVDVTVETTGDVEGVKRDLGVPEDAASCHTIEFGDYLIEGHVPLEAIEELFADQPAVDGLTAPGMPRHSPGMGPPGDEPLTVYAFEASGDVFEYTEV